MVGSTISIVDASTRATWPVIVGPHGAGDHLIARRLAAVSVRFDLGANGAPGHRRLPSEVRWT
jgi:hypothetical protein